MLSRTASTILRRSAARYMSTEAAASTSMTLNFNLPHETIYDGATVASVIIPGSEGEYGVTVDHVPTVAQLKPGVLQIFHEDGETEKYFCPGGFALTHPNSVTDISCPEAIKLDDIDQGAVTANYAKAQAAAAAAASGSVEEAEAMIDMEVNKAMAVAVGITLQ
mmetsp:Transcript_20854/g.37879  ORF Transcript_20854/g.37879 Transcript_20854/m.37879 type:complete len:164 (+) Transcript_20854:54-545(+)